MARLDDDKNFIECEDDEFLQYTLNITQNISNEHRKTLQNEYFNIPFAWIYKMVLQQPKKETQPTKLEIISKDYRTICLFLEREEALKLFENLKTLAFPHCIRDYSYCMVHFNNLQVKRRLSKPVMLKEAMEKLDYDSVTSLSAEDGWNIYDFKREFHRQGVDKTISVFATLRCWSQKDTLWPTYPQKVYVPYTLKDHKAVIYVSLENLILYLEVI